MSDINKQMYNTMIGMKHDLSMQSKQLCEMRGAFQGLRSLTDNLLRYTALSHPMLAYRLRCMRSCEETRQMRKVIKDEEARQKEFERLKAETKKMRKEVKELRNMAKKFLNDGERGSVRAMAAEIVDLRTKLAKYIKKDGKQARK